MPVHAQGSLRPVWPLDDAPAWPPRASRRFGVSRGDGERHHTGIDLGALEGTVVRAMEPGTVVATLRFNGPHAHAILIEHDSGLVVLYGEIWPGSWKQWGLSLGSRVKAGDPIGTVGINPNGSTMLHLETYRPGTRRNYPWYRGQPAPKALLDPTRYLERAARGQSLWPSPITPQPVALPAEQWGVHLSPVAPTPAKGIGLGVFCLAAGLTGVVLGNLKGKKR